MERVYVGGEEVENFKKELCTKMIAQSSHWIIQLIAECEKDIKDYLSLFYYTCISMLFRSISLFAFLFTSVSSLFHPSFLCS